MVLELTQQFGAGIQLGSSARHSTGHCIYLGISCMVVYMMVHGECIMQLEGLGMCACVCVCVCVCVCGGVGGWLGGVWC